MTLQRLTCTIRANNIKNVPNFVNMWPMLLAYCSRNSLFAPNLTKIWPDLVSGDNHGFMSKITRKSLKKEICSGCLIWLCWSKLHSVRAICHIFHTMHKPCIITEDSKTINLTKELLVKLLWICQSMKSVSLYKVTKFIIFDKCKHLCGFAQETHLNLPF